MKAKPLNEMEVFELLRAAYPERFTDDEDETWDAALEFAGEFGYDELRELLGRVVMLTMPMRTGMTGRLSHCLGAVTIKANSVDMVAAVRRDAIASQEVGHDSAE